MAIIVLKAWYLDTVLSAAQVQSTQPDLRLSKTGLLKTGMRADFLDDVDQVKNSLWFQRYLEGELVEFYLEGSGSYSISNLDLISREIYFNKRNTFVHTEPILFFCQQSYAPESSQAIQKVLSQVVETINQQSPLMPLKLDGSAMAEDGSISLDAGLLRKIKSSLLVIADVTPISSLNGQPIPSPQVCVEVGYALQTKRPEQILLVHLQGKEPSGRFPFEIDPGSYVLAKDPKQLQTLLSDLITRQLQRIRLIA